MFFLRELPTKRMIDGYVSSSGTGNTHVIADALSMLRTASRLTRALDAYFASHGVSQLKFLILVVIDRELDRESLRQSEIKQRLDVSKPVLHRTVTALLGAGLLVRLDDPDDSRAHQLGLSSEGKGKLLAMMPGYFDVICGFMDQEKPLLDLENGSAP